MSVDPAVLDAAAGVVRDWASHRVGASVSVATHVSEVIQRLWSGYGALCRVRVELSQAAESAGAALRGSASLPPPVVVCKYIVLPAADPSTGLSVGERRKRRSYEVEAAWYRLVAPLLQAHGAPTPRPFAIEVHTNAPLLPACLPCADNNAPEGRAMSLPMAPDTAMRPSFLVMSDLAHDGFADSRPPHTDAAVVRGALTFLARMHGTFLVRRADFAAAAEQLWPAAQYWHLATREEELANLPAVGFFRTHAAAIDAALRAAPQTLCHGDAKLPNFVFAREAAAGGSAGPTSAREAAAASASLCPDERAESLAQQRTIEAAFARLNSDADLTDAERGGEWIDMGPVRSASSAVRAVTSAVSGRRLAVKAVRVDRPSHPALLARATVLSLLKSPHLARHHFIKETPTGFDAFQELLGAPVVHPPAFGGEEEVNVSAAERLQRLQAVLRTVDAVLCGLRDLHSVTVETPSNGRVPMAHGRLSKDVVLQQQGGGGSGTLKLAGPLTSLEAPHGDAAVAGDLRAVAALLVEYVTGNEVPATGAEVAASLEETLAGCTAADPALVDVVRVIVGACVKSTAKAAAVLEILRAELRRIDAAVSSGVALADVRSALPVRRAAAVDFQYSGVGNGMCDVAYLLHSTVGKSFPPTPRAAVTADTVARSADATADEACYHEWRREIAPFLEHYFTELRAAMVAAAQRMADDADSSAVAEKAVEDARARNVAVEASWRGLMDAATLDYWRFYLGWASLLKPGPEASDAEAMAACPGYVRHAARVWIASCTA